MKLPIEPTASMPRPKLWLYLLLLMMAAGLAVLLVRGGFITDDRLAGMMISLMLTLFIISLVELVPEAATILGRWSEAGEFRRFFGDAALKHDVALVCAHRKLDPFVSRDPWITHHPLPAGIEKAAAEGVNLWLATQDIQAAIYLSGMLSRFTSKTVLLRHDRDVDRDEFDFCAISLGLGFNGFTHRLAGWCENKLFEIQWGHSVKADFTTTTDFFSIGSDTVPQPPHGKDDCIVARVVPRTEPGKPQRVCFVCAGRTAAGTAAAGFYLARRWQKLLELYKKCGKDLSVDSMVVVVRHAADPSGAQEYDSTGVLAQDAGEPLIRWGRVAGIE